MGTRGGHDEYYESSIPPKILEMKEEDKFFSRLLSKETCNNSKDSSFRVLYYGGAAGAIPFTWESRPGTPKHTFSDTCSSLPPLTPPPSYQTIPFHSRPDRKPNKLLQFLRMPSSSHRKNKSSAQSPSFSSSSFSSSSYSNSISTPIRFNNKSRFRRCSTSADQSLHFGIDVDEDEDEQTPISPISTLCFRRGRTHSGSGSGSSGGSNFKMKNMKKRVLSLVGHS